MRQLAGFDQGRNTNPEFSADGRSLYFVATPDGIPNIYRASIAVGSTGPATAATRITNVRLGRQRHHAADAGALGAPPRRRSWCSPSSRKTTTTSTRPTTTAAPQGRRPSPTATPPSCRRTTGGPVTWRSCSPRRSRGCRRPTAYPEKDYTAKLGLDQVGQPTVGVGADRFGAYAAGGLSFLWSDMLGEPRAGHDGPGDEPPAGVRRRPSAISIARRAGTGAFVGEQTPYVTGGFARGITTSTAARPSSNRRTASRRLTARQAASSHYPFSRAQRVEFTAGARQISFDQDVETRVFSLVTGNEIDRTIEELPRPDSLMLGEAGTALVYDSSLMGATGPILGQRYRFEFTQIGGSLSYSGVLDRLPALLHAGASVHDRAARPALRPLRRRRRRSAAGADVSSAIPGLVRGYEINSFDATECVVNAASCAAFDQLVGSRIAVAGAELRFPLFGVFSRRSFYGPLPIEIALLRRRRHGLDQGRRAALARRQPRLGAQRRHCAAAQRVRLTRFWNSTT